jgi:Ca2+-binding RTX toxin-like protein
VIAVIALASPAALAPGAVAAPRCTIEGTSGPDVLRGTPGSDYICGYGGADVIRGLGGNDRILGGGGNDRILGGGGPDRILGGPGDDRILGGRGNDNLAGGAGDDIVRGNAGRDLLRGTAAATGSSAAARATVSSVDALAISSTPATACEIASTAAAAETAPGSTAATSPSASTSSSEHRERLAPLWRIHFSLSRLRRLPSLERPRVRRPEARRGSVDIRGEAEIRSRGLPVTSSYRETFKLRDELVRGGERCPGCPRRGSREQNGRSKSRSSSRRHVNAPTRSSISRLRSSRRSRIARAVTARPC